MKITLLGKNLFLLVVLLTTAFTFNSCRKELLVQSPDNLKNALSIAEAKGYFETQVKNKTPKSKGNSTFSTKGTEGILWQDVLTGINPVWDVAKFKGLHSGKSAVVTPIYKKGVYVRISEKKMVKFGFLNYLMMYKDAKDNIITEWVELKPTERWIDSRVSRNYEGKIIVRNWDGSIKKVYNYSNGSIVAGAVGLGQAAKKTGTTVMNGGESEADDPLVCYVSTTITIISGETLCPCEGHTFSQFNICTCPNKPTQGYSTSIVVETEYNCSDEPPLDPPIGGGGGSNGGGEPEPGNGNGSGGGTSSGDYPPDNCNPGQTPTDPLPEGTEYMVPCSDMSIPGEDPADGPLDPYQGLDISAEVLALAGPLRLTVEEAIFLDSRPDIFAAINVYVDQNGPTEEVGHFLKWAVGYLLENQYTINFDDFKRDFLTGDVGLDVSDLGTDGSGQNMNYDIYFDDIDGEFKFISKSDPNYNNVINNGTTALPTQFLPATTQLLRQMGKDKGWDVGVSTLEFNRRVGQAFQEATYKLYRSKLNPLQLPRVTYQPQNNISLWRKREAGNSGKVIPDWTFDVSYGFTSLALPQHMFYDAKAVNGPLYLSSSKYQIGGYIDVLSRKKVNNAPPPALVFVTPVNTIISPSILADAISKGVQIRQAFVIIINNKLYLLNSIEITPANDRFYNIPLNVLKIIAGPVDLEYPVNPNNGPDYEELQQ